MQNILISINILIVVFFRADLFTSCIRFEHRIIISERGKKYSVTVKYSDCSNCHLFMFIRVPRTVSACIL